MKYIGIALVALGTLTGCATTYSGDPYASPGAWSARAECERNNGVWREVHNMCEYQSPGFP
jgi:hypothetical protein